MANLVTPKGRTMEYLAGDPSGLASEATRLKNVAATIDQLSDLLGQINTGQGSQASKVDTIREQSGEAKTALDRARELYNKTGWALSEYQTQLNTSVSNAKTAYDNAVAYLPLVNSAESAVSSANNLYNRSRTEQDGIVFSMYDTVEATPENIEKEADALEALNAAKNTRTARQAVLLGYKQQWDTAYDDLNTAAETARSRISAAVEANPAKDTWWDDVAAFLDAMSDILGWIILALVIVALIFTGPFALIALALATALTIVNLIAHTALAATGKGDWMDVALDLVGLIPFGKLFTTGGGLLARLGATGRGALEGLDFIGQLRNGFAAREAVANVMFQSRYAMNEAYQLNREIAADLAYNNATGDIMEAILRGGDREMARLSEALGDMVGYNPNVRAAIEVAEGIIGNPGTMGDAFYAGMANVASDIKLGADMSNGNDWVTNQVIDLFTPDPTASDLKARIMGADTLVAATPTTNPYAD